MSFLPINRDDMDQRGWDMLDFLFITGDAYVDHPSFGAALLTRLLEARGYRVGVIARPDPNDDQAFLVMGRPLYGVFISSGVVDSMVNNYTSAGKTRSEDRYAPGGIGGQRPDRSLIRYCNMARKQLGDLPLIIGGVEASLRRFAHYDVWSDKVRRSILQDTQADLLIYGMGELPIQTIADLLARGADIKKINSIPGTCIFAAADDLPKNCRAFVNELGDYQLEADLEELRKLQKTAETAAKGKKSRIDRGFLRGLFPEDDKFIMLPPYEQCTESKTAYAAAFAKQYQEQDPGAGKTMIQRHGRKFLVQNPPQKPMTPAQFDEVYALDYERKPHPMYDQAGGVPAIEEVRFSVNSHRGCYGGCNFCAITFHQGRIIQRRSDQSVLDEVETITQMPDFKGYIHDIGGPTANFHEPACEKQDKGFVCKHRQCMSPKPCPSLRIGQHSYLELLRKARQMPGVKKVFVRSGVRYDYALMDPDRSFIDELIEYHVSGQLKVAPEHVSKNALEAMGKPPAWIYDEFKELYEQINKEKGLRQYLVPYLISGHPGCTLDDAIELALYIKANRVMPEQVQDFYATPGTVSTTMYHTHIDPFTLKDIHVPDRDEKRLQRALLQFGKPENRAAAIKALRLAGRNDLIGYGEECLLAASSVPRRNSGESRNNHSGKSNRSGAGKTNSSNRPKTGRNSDNRASQSRGTGSGNDRNRTSSRNNQARGNSGPARRNDKPGKGRKG